MSLKYALSVVFIVHASFLVRAYDISDNICPMSGNNLHPDSSMTVTIPWVEQPKDGPFDFVEAPTVHARISKSNFVTTNAAPLEMLLDTGSCGIVLAKSFLEDWDDEEATTANEGYIFLSSSKRLYPGHWVWRNVYYNHQDIKSRVRVLVISEWIYCPNYVIGKDGRDCKNTKGSKINKEPKTMMMGIGFGRTSDGQAEGTPDKNPLLNIEEIRSSPIGDDFWPGWIITPNGLTVGLTQANFDRPGFQDRQAHLPRPEPTISDEGLTRTDIPHHYPWSELRGCVSVEAVPSPCLKCSVLLDTGVDQSYIRLDGDPTNSSSWPTWTSEWSSHVQNRTRYLDHGLTVNIQLGVPGVASLKYVTGDSSNPVTPSYVNQYFRKNTLLPYLNTGRHIFRAWEVAFDPVCGTLSFNPTRTKDKAHLEL